MSKTNVVYQHVKGGGRFYTSYDPEKNYKDDEHHLIVAVDVTDEMAQELCHERANENAKSFLDSLPEEMRDPTMDAEIRDMLGADPVSDERKMGNFELLADANLMTLTPIIYAEPDDNIVFNVGEHMEMLKLCENGDIYVKGKLVENDMEVVDGMRAMIKEFTGLK